MPELRDNALCLRQWDWSETSQTVALLTREHGVLRGLAKGAKREKAPFSGGFEVLTIGEVAAITKQPGRLANVIAWDLRESHPGFRRDLRTLYAGMLVIDLIANTLEEGDPHPGLFDAAARCLGALSIDPGGPVGPPLGTLLFKLLTEIGFRPNLEHAVSDEGRGAEAYGFDRGGGSLVPDPGEHDPARVWRVRSDTVGYLLRLTEGGGRHRPDAGDERVAEVAYRAAKLLAAYAADRAERPVPSVGLVFPDLA